MNLAKYRKAVVAGVGFALIAVSQVAGVTVADNVDDALIGLFDAVVALLSAVGVHQVPNE